MTQIAFVTGNKGKLAEVQALLGNDVRLRAITIDLPELQGKSSRTIAVEKMRTALDIARSMGQGRATADGEYLLTEDTSLSFAGLRRQNCAKQSDAADSHSLTPAGGVATSSEVDGWEENLPGPYIKWFLEGVGLEGLVTMASAFGDTRACATCSFTLAQPSNAASEIRVIVGRCYGRIVAPRGDNGFGWDAVFEPDEQPHLDCVSAGGQRKTFAEMSKEEKNVVSHRAKAIAALKEFMMKEPTTHKRPRSE